MPRNHHAHVHHFIAIALQDHANDILADIVYIALYRGHDDRALGLGIFAAKQRFFFLDEGDEMGDCFLHHARGFDHLG